MAKKTWDIEEMVALIDVFFKCKNDKTISVNDELIKLSKELNIRAEKLGIPRDEKYRNFNGMKLMYQNVCYIDSKGEKGMSASSKMMNYAYNMYFAESERFNDILSIFKNKYCDDIDGANDMNNEIIGIEIADDRLYRDNVNLLYDEILLIYYFYRSAFENNKNRQMGRDVLHEILDKIAVHYELNSKISDKTIDITLEKIKQFFMQKKNSRIHSDIFNPFIKHFLLKYEEYSIEKLNYKVSILSSRYESNNFDDDNFFQKYCLENIENFDLPIEDCSFSVRTLHGLQKYRIKNVFDLLCLAISELYAIKNMGVKCVEEIKAFVSSLLQKLNDTNIEIDKEKEEYFYLKNNADKLFSGDFSDLNEESNPIISKYKYAHEIIDQDLIIACNTNPMYVCSIIQAFNDFTRFYDIISKRKNTINVLLNKLTETKRKNRYIYYARAYKFNDSHIIDSLYSSRSNNIEDFYYTFDYTNDVKYEMLESFVNWCSFDVASDIKVFFEQHFNGKSAVVIEYRASKMTLEQVGTKLQITRERVRQLEAKIQRVFDHSLIHKKFFHKIRAELNGKSVITFEDVCKFSSDYGKELWFLFKNSKNTYYKYDTKKNVLVVCEDDFNEKIHDFISTLPFSISVNSLNEKFNSQFEQDLLVDLNDLLNQEYILYNGYYFKRKFNNTDMFSGLVEAFFPEGIRIYEIVNIT